MLLLLLMMLLGGSFSICSSYSLQSVRCEEKRSWNSPPGTTYMLVRSRQPSGLDNIDSFFKEPFQTSRSFVTIGPIQSIIEYPGGGGSLPFCELGHCVSRGHHFCMQPGHTPSSTQSRRHSVPNCWNSLNTKGEGVTDRPNELISLTMANYK